MCWELKFGLQLRYNKILQHKTLASGLCLCNSGILYCLLVTTSIKSIILDK